jgi:hypothetical protein
VTVHAKQLNFITARWTSGTVEHDVEQISYNLKETTATLVFGTPLAAGQAVLFIEFTGHLNADMNGFYRGVYTDIEGVHACPCPCQPRTAQGAGAVTR